MHRRVGLARAVQVHPAVFEHPVAAAGGGGLPGVPRGGVVHRRAGSGGSAANNPAGTRDAASGATKPTCPAAIAAAFAQETSLESPTSKNGRGPAIFFSAVIAPVTWATSPAPPS